MIERLIFSLLLTLLLEQIYAFCWGIRKKDLWLVILLNILTNPLVFLFHNATHGHGIVLSIILPELVAVAVEAYFLKRFNRNILFPVLFAVCVNAFSFLSGLLVDILIYGG
jgi:hypothetical protein